MFCGRCPEALVCSFDDIFDQRSTFLLGFTCSNAHSAQVNKFSLMKKKAKRGKFQLFCVFSLNLKNVLHVVLIIFNIWFFQLQCIIFLNCFTLAVCTLIPFRFQRAKAGHLFNHNSTRWSLWIIVFRLETSCFCPKIGEPRGGRERGTNQGQGEQQCIFSPF